MNSESISTLQNMFTNSHISSLDQMVSLETLNHFSSQDPHSTSLLLNLSVLKHKLHQIQSLAGTFIPGNENPPEPSPPACMAADVANSLIQDLIMAASSMLLTCQQMSLVPNLAAPGTRPARLPPSCGIVELEASDLLAKYTHHCHVCGKGFKRDANLRMHMRAHGEEYKAAGALNNPARRHGRGGEEGLRYSCPEEGCRWNKKHVKFQPLKSLVCVKNHYKRTHCPKIYVCKRCNRKQFSVVSDLRTHEKHCGVVKWVCSCGTSFSRKDKLIGHVGLFVGHSPAVGSFGNLGNL